MADLLNRANVDTAINTLLDDAQPNEAIQPSDHNGLLKNILDTLANGLSVTLRTNPETAGQDIEVTSGDKVKFKNSTFFNSVVTDTLTADRTLTLPNKTGTIAILSDIENLFTDDLTLGANRSHNAVEYDWKITHNATDGSVNTVGIDTGKISHEGSRTATNSSYSSKWFWGQFLSTFTDTNTSANTTISQTNSVINLSNTDAVNDTAQMNLSPTVLNAQQSGATTTSDLALENTGAFLSNTSGSGAKSCALDLRNTLGQFRFSEGNVVSFNEVNNSYANMKFLETGTNAGGGELSISRSSGHVFTDSNTNGSGLRYNADYSANYTSRSLVDKAFVLANAGGSSIYTASGNVPSSIVATLTDNLTIKNGTLKVEGSDTLSTSKALEIYDGDTTPNLLWDFRNNGDIIQGSSDINYDLTGNKRITYLGGRIKIDVVASSGTFEFHKNSTKFLEINGNIDLFQSFVKRFNNPTNANFFIDFANTTTVSDAQWYSTGTVLTHTVRTGSNQRAHFNLNGSGTFIAGGTVNMPNLPTSSSGLSAGDVWNDGGTLKIV